jgi:gamma-butyrobetaine dioxygenase
MTRANTLPATTRAAEVAGVGVRVRSGRRQADLHPRWLRDRSTEPGQIDPANRQRLFTPLDIDPDLVVLRCELRDDVLLVAFSDHHVAHLSFDAIALALGWAPDDEAPPGPEPWVGCPVRFPRIDWSPIGWTPDEGGPEAVLAALDAVARHGFVVLENLPVDEGTVRRVGDRLGYVVDQNFGAVFDVRVEPDPADLAYTSVALPAHTDLPYRNPPPGLQLLHCLVQEAPGGESILVDGLAAWEAIRNEEPELFRSLCEVDVEFRYDIGADTVVARGPVFELDRAGGFRSIRFNTKLDAPVAAGGPDVERWYRGRRWLAGWLADPANRLVFRLGPGDLVCFDNHRILHGRTAFDSRAGRRHLQGCYIGHDGPDTLRRLTWRRLAGNR